MRKISKLLLGIICVGSLVGCGKEEVKREGSVKEAVTAMQEVESLTLDMEIAIKVPAVEGMNVSYKMLTKIDENGNSYTEASFGEEVSKSYEIVQDGEQCYIDYDEEEEKWYGDCYPVEEEEEAVPEDIDFASFLEEFEDADFIYQDEWYVLNETKTAELKQALADMGADELLDMTSMVDLELRVQLANGKIETIEISFNISEMAIKTYYTLSMKISDVNKTKVKAPTFEKLS